VGAEGCRVGCWVGCCWTGGASTALLLGEVVVVVVAVVDVVVGVVVVVLVVLVVGVRVLPWFPPSSSIRP
jgi:hypothetical protein